MNQALAIQLELVVVAMVTTVRSMKFVKMPASRATQTSPMPSSTLREIKLKLR
jgi:hypothetical protein